MAATVLVVNEEALTAEDVRDALQRLAYAVTGPPVRRADARSAAERLRPSLVVLDSRSAPEASGRAAGSRVNLAAAPLPSPSAASPPSTAAWALAAWIALASDLRKELRLPVVIVRRRSDQPFLSLVAREGHGGEADVQATLAEPFEERGLGAAIHLAEWLVRLPAPSAPTLTPSDGWLPTVLDAVGDGVVGTDRDGAVAFMNSAAERLVGLGRAESIGRPLAEVVDLRDPPASPPSAEANDAPARAPRWLVRRAGSRLTVEDVQTPVLSSDGTLAGRLLVLRDVTERRKLEQRLAQTERLASIGTMAAGMAHEINNPLAYVITNIGLSIEALLEATGQPPKGASGPGTQLREIVDGLREANDGAERIRRIVLDLKKFARVEDGALSVVDLADVLDAAAKITANAVRHHARLRKQYAVTPLVEANEGQLIQVFTNLLMNAAQAIGEGQAEHHEIVVSTRTDPVGRAVVEVHDNGPGVPPEILTRIFDPFFTSKPPGAGMGLGLAICQNIIASLGGEITAESTRQSGTTFRVSLPPTRTSSTRTRAAQPLPPPGSARRGRVLVVDDEVAVANSIARMLRAQHDVVVETEPRHALARLVGGEGYDVIFCDLMMPSMSGIDLYRGLAASSPEQAKRMVFMTGGAFSPRSQAFLENVGNVSVAKPFTIHAIRTIVNDYVK